MKLIIADIYLETLIKYFQREKNFELRIDSEDHFSLIAQILMKSLLNFNFSYFAQKESIRFFNDSTSCDLINSSIIEIKEKKNWDKLDDYVQERTLEEQFIDIISNDAPKAATITDGQKVLELVLKDKQILCTICARGGSKGLPNKNLLKIGDKSLIGHTLTQAKAIDAIDCIIVSSDSNEILKEGEIYAADILLQRSAKLASDDAGKIDAIIDCLNHAESNLNKHFDYVIDLDVTSPLRNLIDIENCLEFTKDQGFKNLITVTNSKKNPYFNQIEITNEGPQLVKVGIISKNEQSAPKVYDMNFQYVWSRDFNK